MDWNLPRALSLAFEIIHATDYDYAFDRFVKIPCPTLNARRIREQQTAWLAGMPHPTFVCGGGAQTAKANGPLRRSDGPVFLCP